MLFPLLPTALLLLLLCSPCLCDDPAAIDPTSYLSSQVWGWPGVRMHACTWAIWACSATLQQLRMQQLRM